MSNDIVIAEHAGKILGLSNTLVVMEQDNNRTKIKPSTDTT